VKFDVEATSPSHISSHRRKASRLRGRKPENKTFDKKK